MITLYSNNKYYALSHKDNKLTAVQVTVSNNQITSEITEDMVWSYKNSKLFYENEDNGTVYYLYCSSSGSNRPGSNTGATLSISTTNSSTVSFSSNRLKIGSYYLRYTNGSIKADRTSATCYLFMENEK